MVAAPWPVSVRSYGTQSAPDRHDFGQLVLPLTGRLAIAVAGHEQVLDRSLAAWVEPGAPHEQQSRDANRSLIVDLDLVDLGERTAESLTRRRFLRRSAEANHLIDYMGAMLAGGPPPAHRLRLWAPLLIDALLGDEAAPRSRLATLLAALEANPARPWRVEQMAAEVGVSVSRLHALFLAELGQSPHAWLADLRVARIRDALARTDLPIAELAYRFGFADQSAMTRALRRATGLTPGAWRRRAREQAGEPPGSKAEDRAGDPAGDQARDQA